MTHKEQVKKIISGEIPPGIEKDPLESKENDLDKFSFEVVPPFVHEHSEKDESH